MLNSLVDMGGPWIVVSETNTSILMANLPLRGFSPCIIAVFFHLPLELGFERRGMLET